VREARDSFGGLTGEMLWMVFRVEALSLEFVVASERRLLLSGLSLFDGRGMGDEKKRDIRLLFNGGSLDFDSVAGNVGFSDTVC